jgi:hypothetical protein
MRALAGIVAGLIVAIIAFVAIGVVGVGFTYSPPSGTSLSDSGRVAELLVGMPTGAKIALLVAVAGAAMAGAALAKLIARQAWPAWTVTGIIACYAGLSMLSLPLSGLAQALTVIAPLLGGLIGNHLVASRDPLPGNSES